MSVLRYVAIPTYINKGKSVFNRFNRLYPDSNVYLEDIFKIFLSDISDVFKMFSQISVGGLIRQWRRGLEDVCCRYFEDVF